MLEVSKAEERQIPLPISNTISTYCKSNNHQTQMVQHKSKTDSQTQRTAYSLPRVSLGKWGLGVWDCGEIFLYRENKQLSSMGERNYISIPCDKS